MLKQFNDLYSQVILEQTEDTWSRIITKDNDFFKKYLVPLIEKCKVQISKARLNTFRVGSSYEAIKKFLEEFKVDNEYLPQTGEYSEFRLYSPMISFAESKHYMDRTEGYPEDTVDQNSLYAQENYLRTIVDGRWYEPKELDENNEFQYPVKAKYATPKDLIKMIDILIESLGYTNKNLIIIIEFQLNCENLANQCYDEMSVYRPAIIEVNKEKTVDIADICNDTDKMSEPTAKSEMPKVTETNDVKVPVSIKNDVSLKHPETKYFNDKNKIKIATINLNKGTIKNDK